MEIWVTCWDCQGEIYTHHDCGEDTCCCLYPEDNVICTTCRGAGGWKRETDDMTDEELMECEE